MLCVRTSLGNCDRKFAACPFIQPPSQLLLSVCSALIRRYTPLSQVCITVELRMRGMQAHRHQVSLADVWWSLGYEKILVLTPQAGAFVRRAGVIIRSGLALADGTVRGSSS